MKDRKIWYKDVMERDFERVDCNDDIYEEHYGHQYYYVVRNFCRGLSLCWNMDSLTVTLWLEEDKITSNKKREIKSLEELDELINVLDLLTSVNDFIESKIEKLLNDQIDIKHEEFNFNNFADLNQSS